MDFDILRPWLTLDPWQKDYIHEHGNCFLLCGRQVGKSTAASLKAVELAIHHYKRGEDILIIATTERQAYNLFSKALNYALSRYPAQVSTGRDKPTKHELKFKNGVKIMCHPTGLMGEGLRGFTLKRIIADEAARMAPEVFTAILPMISVTGGAIDILSTPCGKEGFFYEASLRDDFKKFYVSAEDCPRHKPEFLESEKKTMSKLEYCQEYMALFLDDLKKLFDIDLIKECCVCKRPNGIKEGSYYSGHDIARLGNDEIAHQILYKAGKDRFVQVESIVQTKKRLNETYDKILDLNRIYNFKAIGVDDGGIGVSIFDFLLNHNETKNKIIPLNNAKRTLDKDGKTKKGLLKEDMYNNLVGMMERGEIKLLDDDELIDSLNSVQYEYIVKKGRPTSLRIFSPDHDRSHIVEGLVRAAWLAGKDKHLNLWVRY